jgi:hypothetical protein
LQSGYDVGIINGMVELEEIKRAETLALDVRVKFLYDSLI